MIGGKLSLGRSFGLMPANRGVVSTGLYRLVRHPIYMGYLITHVGFLLANATFWNVLIFVAADVALMIRAVYEERVARARSGVSRLPGHRALASGAGGLLRTLVKSQAPSSKSQPRPTPNAQNRLPTPKSQPSPSEGSWELGFVFGVWDLGVVGIWSLELGI